MEKAPIINDLKTAHEKGLEKARKKMPKLDTNELIELVTKVVKKDISKFEAAKILAKKYKKPIEIYIDTFAHVGLEEVMKHSNVEIISHLGNKKFVNNMFISVKDISKFVKDYSEGKIDEIELIDKLCNSKLKDIGNDILNELNVDFENIKNAFSSGETISVLMTSLIALSQSYSILMGVKEDAKIAYENRLRIEEECNKSIELMRNYRNEMNEVVSKYLCDHLETFKIGFEAMDKAIIENDINGYIKGNNTIQEILNYDIQFGNEEEFDELMDSDIAFKL